MYAQVHTGYCTKSHRMTNLLLMETGDKVLKEEGGNIIHTNSFVEYKITNVTDDGITKMINYKLNYTTPTPETTPLGLPTINYTRILISSGQFSVASGGDHIVELKSRANTHWNGMNQTEKDAYSCGGILPSQI